MTVTSAQILRRAAQILPVNGRAIGEYYGEPPRGTDSDPSKCPVCALGAIALAAGCDLTDMSLWDPQRGPEDQAMDAARALADHLRLIKDREDPSTLIDLIGNWNDNPQRTDADVIATLTAAADALDKQRPDVRGGPALDPAGETEYQRERADDLDGRN